HQGEDFAGGVGAFLDHGAAHVVPPQSVDGSTILPPTSTIQPAGVRVPARSYLVNELRADVGKLRAHTLCGLLPAFRFVDVALGVDEAVHRGAGHVLAVLFLIDHL